MLRFCYLGKVCNHNYVLLDIITKAYSTSYEVQNFDQLRKNINYFYKDTKYSIQYQKQNFIELIKK